MIRSISLERTLQENFFIFMLLLEEFVFFAPENNACVPGSSSESGNATHSERLHRSVDGHWEDAELVDRALEVMDAWRVLSIADVSCVLELGCSLLEDGTVPDGGFVRIGLHMFAAIAAECPDKCRVPCGVGSL
jgi:hypothetical protein